ncbi:hypothetical protein FRC0306_01825 [Corynebacterium diphtheriae]|nr:hypothetical protein FRC0306_01825 [Corynebacterium diphtheriae]
MAVTFDRVGVFECILVGCQRGGEGLRAGVLFIKQFKDIEIGINCFNHLLFLSAYIFVA